MSARRKMVGFSLVFLGAVIFGLAQERVTLFGLAFNPAGPEYLDGRLNIFSVPQVREAMNYLVDRGRIVAEIYGGNGVPWCFPVSKAYLEALGLQDVATELTQKYAHDFEKGKNIVFEELRKMGATLEPDGWYYKGRPVSVQIVARAEDERKALGAYLAELLKGLALRTEVLYKTAREFSALVMYTDPREGKWDIATEGWIVGVDDKAFEGFYTPRGPSAPLWQAYKPLPELDTVAQKLAQGAYSNEEERKNLVAQALKLSLQDSVRIWLLYR